MKEEFFTFQKFNDPLLAESLRETLEQNNILYTVEASRRTIDPFLSNELDIEIRVKIKTEDFERAEQLITSTTKTEIERINKEYPLFKFTNEELIEIIIKPDEWTPLDYQLAQKLLKERGSEVNPDVLKALKKQRFNELTKQEESQKAWIYLAYALALMGGLLGVFIGWYLSTHKKTLPDGERVYAYNENDRWHGKYIFLTGMVAMVFWLVISLIKGYRESVSYY